jgi:hypothetical protein
MSKAPRDHSAAPHRIAMVFDDRLSHDRKSIFARTLTILKSRFTIDIIAGHTTEEEMLAQLEKEEYTLILLPWYKYISWKKIDSFFGSLRLQGPCVAGYFADPVMSFDFSALPNYHRLILLDFYRFDQTEMEFVLQSFLQVNRRSGFSGVYAKNTTVYYSNWYDHDAHSTRCLDYVFKMPLFQNTAWNARSESIRFYLTALWSLCFQEKRSALSSEPCAELEIAEFNKRLAIKLVFESNDLTLKQMMEYFWPNHSQPHQTIGELVRHSDFIRVHHYPETHKIEITAFFIPSAPSLHYPTVVRGYWIEPLKMKYLKTKVNPGEEELFLKRLPIVLPPSELLSQNMQMISEYLRSTLELTAEGSPEEKNSVESHIQHIRNLLTELEKKVAEKKKVA